jgi:acetyl esterase/lipase
MLNKEINLFDDEIYGNLYTYILNPKISTNVLKKRPAIIICPGGGYMTSATKEGEGVAMAFLSKGYHCFVLRYSTYFNHVKNKKENGKSNYPGPLLELMESIRIIKENAEDWYVDAENIFVLGFSAGGHMSATLSVRWDEKLLLNHFGKNVNASLFKPKGVLLCYPTLNLENCKTNFINHENEEIKKQGAYFYPAIFGEEKPTKCQLEYLNIINYIREDMPPVFLWHTYDDKIANVKDSAEFVYKLIQKNINCEFHLFDKGKHGLALANDVYAKTDDDINSEVSEWINLANKWIKNQIIL